MRAAFSILTLFAVAVAVALLAGNNQGTITLFWPPHRVDLSLNLALLLMVLAFVVLHVALKALAALFAIPQEARRWRLQHKERGMHLALLESLSHLQAGRFIRGRKAAELVLLQESAVAQSADPLSYAARLRAMAHLLAAESAHALQNREVRDSHFAQALAQAAVREGQETREGLQLRAARWALDDRDAPAALRWLDDMPQGAARRTAALRLRLKAARLAGQTAGALDTARLLAKHRAFSAEAGPIIVRGLVLELIAQTHDAERLKKVWTELDSAERAMPDVAIRAASRWLELGGAVAESRQWLLPVWDHMQRGATAGVNALTQAQRMALVQVLARGFEMSHGTPDTAWLARIESAQMRNPGDGVLQYLAGMTCMHLQLWGKATQLLKQSLPFVAATPLAHSAWMALAALAERRDDADAATEAFKRAAELKPTSHAA
jgi:HemY protein